MEREHRQDKAGHSLQHPHDDEIDLIDLFVKIWKWKWLTAAFIIISTVSTFLFVKLTPGPEIKFTVNSTILLGKVGDYSIQDADLIMGDTLSFLYSKTNNLDYKVTVVKPKDKDKDKDKDKIERFYKADISDKYNNQVITFNYSQIDSIINISITSTKKEVSLDWVKSISDEIINRHRKIYKDVLKQATDEFNLMRKMNVYIDGDYIKTKLLYENQKYPTHYIVEPALPATHDPSPGKKLGMKTAVAFFASLFMGIFISFVIDYIGVIRREIKARAL